MHCILAQDCDDPSFKPEPIRKEEALIWVKNLEDTLTTTLNQISEKIESFSPELQPLLEKMTSQPEQHIRKMHSLVPFDITLLKTRHHGDLHLGQILLVANDFIIIDFEGEPARPLNERLAKHCPIRDVAGVIRSLSYAAETARRKVKEEKPEAFAIMNVYTREWERTARERFLQGYLEAAAGCASVPAEREVFDRILKLFCIEKALYEFSYELNNRPEWLEIPVHGLIECLDLQRNQ
jgi:maltose alpha-D-glucosyltransferase/alpha-amylase